TAGSTASRSVGLRRRLARRIEHALGVVDLPALVHDVLVGEDAGPAHAARGDRRGAQLEDRAHRGATYPRRGGHKRRGQSSLPASATAWSRARARRMIRDTCIWETPMMSAISDWVMSSTKRSLRT